MKLVELDIDFNALNKTLQLYCQFIFDNDVFIVLAFAKAEYLTTLS
jgi:hypothetical protein